MHKDEQIMVLIRQLIDVIDAHECTCFSCDNDGETYCDCLKQAANLVKLELNKIENE